MNNQRQRYEFLLSRDGPERAQQFLREAVVAYYANCMKGLIPVFVRAAQECNDILNELDAAAA